jgi:hypothetical protein
MDPITAALAAGAAAGLTNAATQAVMDAYGRLKSALSTRFPQLGVHVQALEVRPDSQSKLAEELVELGAEGDVELLRLAQALMDAVQREAPEAALRAGVDLERVRAGGSMDILGATGDEVGVRGRDWDVGQDVRIRGAQGGEGPNPAAGSPTPSPTFDLDKVRAGRDVNVSAIIVAGATATGTEPRESDIDLAGRVLTALEYRRVLFDPSDAESEAYSIESVLQLRTSLQDMLGGLDRQSLLAAYLREMVRVCGHFLTRTQQMNDDMWHGFRRRVFEEALAEMRGQFGVLIGQFTAAHGLDVTGDLVRIVPQTDG